MKGKVFMQATLLISAQLWPDKLFQEVILISFRSQMGERAQLHGLYPR